MSVLLRISLALVALLLAQVTVAGPIFEIRSNGSEILDNTLIGELLRH